MSPMIRDELRYAIWLEPAPAQEIVYRERIAELRQRFGGPAFPPHLTLTSGLTGAEDDLVAFLHNHCARPIAGYCQVDEVLITGSFFRAVILPASMPLDCETLRHDVRSAAGLDPLTTWQPHLSLLYGEIADDQVAAIQQACRAVAWPPFPLGGCSLWRLCGPVEDWYPVARVAWP